MRKPVDPNAMRIKALEQQLAAEEVQARLRPEFEAAAARAEKDERGLVGELHELGYDVPSVHALMHSRIDYGSAIPAIIKWLPLVKVVGVRDMLVRSLATPKYWRIVAPALVEFFRSDASNEGNVRWSVGNSLETIANDNLFDDIAALIRERRYGTSRRMIALAMGKMKKRRADAVQELIALLDDPTIDGHVLRALKKLKAIEAAPLVGRFLSDKRTWVRNDAEQLTQMAEGDRKEHG